MFRQYYYLRFDSKTMIRWRVCYVPLFSNIGRVVNNLIKEMEDRGYTDIDLIEIHKL